MSRFFKPVISVSLAFLALGAIAACSINPATGERQFTALMSTQQEAGIGAAEHENILRQFGGVVKSPAIQSYVTSLGQRVAKDTERGDVRYQFFVLDSPIVNAFALPGGYVYVTRGLLALANSEAQLASVLAHEVAHITARHSAERYSHGLLSSLGAAALGAAVGSSAAAQVANLGSDLYITSYSRKQESQADELGIRYLSRAGYDTQAMGQFLNNLGQYSSFEGKENGSGDPGFSYFSTHPQTAERAAESFRLAASYPATPAKDVGHNTYLKMIDGLIFGDSMDQGLVRGKSFFHPQMGFTFSVPDKFNIINNSDQIIIRGMNGSVVALFDSAPNPKHEDPMTYLTNIWMRGEKITGADNYTINGKLATSGDFQGVINKESVLVRLVAVQWSPNMFFRFQVAMPRNTGPDVQASLKQMTNSLRTITAQEQRELRPYHLKLVTAGAADSVSSLAMRSAMKTLQEERFRALNGMTASEKITPGRLYKIVAE